MARWRERNRDRYRAYPNSGRRKRYRRRVSERGCHLGSFGDPARRHDAKQDALGGHSRDAHPIVGPGRGKAGAGNLPPDLEPVAGLDVERREVEHAAGVLANEARADAMQRKSMTLLRSLDRHKIPSLAVARLPRSPQHRTASRIGSGSGARRVRAPSGPSHSDNVLSRASMTLLLPARRGSSPPPDSTACSHRVRRLAARPRLFLAHRISTCSSRLSAMHQAGVREKNLATRSGRWG
jgi:hypothetical protein